MLSTTFTATNIGLQVLKIDVEVDSNRGTPMLILIGLPSKAIAEAKERITSALRNCGVRVKNRRTIVNLAPADVRKTSSCLELAIAIAILKMYDEITVDTDDTMFFGELSLDGTIKKINGVLPLVLAAKNLGFKKVIIPQDNAKEVSIISDIDIHPISHLNEYLSFARGEQLLPKLKPRKFTSQPEVGTFDFADIFGQKEAKRALEIAAAGGHNLLMIGPPGAGKSMMAKALVSILPEFTQKEALETTAIYSVCGLNHHGLITNRPFRSPHHTTSQVGLTGGGSQLKPGEISLAHRGILFLDEFPEFSRYSLEALRQPMEDGVVSISRASGSTIYPATFSLIAAANPCPCGYQGSLKKKCICSQYMIDSYTKKLSGPILDRIDMHIRVMEVEIDKLAKRSNTDNEKSASIRQRVSNARSIQNQRFHNTRYVTNSELTSTDIKKLCQLEDNAQSLLNKAAEKLAFSARSYFKIIKVAQTIADLSESKIIKKNHIAEAVQYRSSLERE